MRELEGRGGGGGDRNLKKGRKNKSDTFTVRKSC